VEKQMPIVQEIKKAIAELPIHKATIVKYWLDEFEAARRYKKLKAYTMAVRTLANFEKSNSNSSLN
jgi:hypothetical protein